MSEHPLVSAYRNFSPKSQEYARRAQVVFPGGDTRSSAHYAPYPLAMTHGEGCHLYDLDGHKILDFMNNFTSLIHGHGFAPVVKAVQEQVARGTAFAAPNDDQVALAELIVERVGSVQQMRFTSSGTEGTQMAIRCARAATGKQKIMKMEGGYHGSYELAEVSLVPRPNESGSLAAPTSLPVDDSFPKSVLDDVVICPYNEPDLARALIAQQADELAAVIVEPTLGSMGMIPATPEFLSVLREESLKHNIVLIFDEVITLRQSLGGAQAHYGIQPDLTCMGKIIGGGLPVGAVGGQRELMQLFSPDHPRPVMHASTFSGNALTMAAGRAAMENYNATDIEHINRLGDKLRNGFNAVFAQTGIRGRMLGIGSLNNIQLGANKINGARDTIAALVEAGHISRLLHLTMLRNGVLSATRLMYCVSTVMSDTDIDHAIAAFAASLSEIKPFIEKERPNLLMG